MMKVGIDIGGSHIAVGLVDDNGKIIEKVEEDIKLQDNMEKYIVDYVDIALQKFSKTADISYIGIAGPGNPKGCIISHLVNLGIEQIDFKAIQEKYNIQIESLNDGKASALAEKQYGAMKEFQDAVFLCLGTGIGGAVILNNALLQANRNPGFELGHMIIQKDGIQCNCGKKGCFETYCSMKRFKVNLVDTLKRLGIDASVKDASGLVRLLKENLDKEPVSQLVNCYIDDLIIGLSNIIDIFEPQGIVLGGSFVYFKDVLYQKLMNEMEKRKYVFNKDSLPKIKLAEFQNDAGIIGATLL